MRRGKAFTLVEILVVMAIVALLAAFLVPHLLGQGERAKREATKALIAQIEVAIERYRTELKTAPPDLATLMKRFEKVEIAGDPNDPRSRRVTVVEPLLTPPTDRISQDGKDILDFWGDPLKYDPGRSTGLVWSTNVNGP